jgi:hypothetical protein
MKSQDLEARSDASARAHQAQAILEEIFAEAGWQVRREPKLDHSRYPDLLIRRGKVSYAVEVKAGPEGRSDRLVPLWSQAYLQAIHAAGNEYPPLAVVAAPRIVPRVAEHVLKFAEEYAPDAAAGIIDFAGLRQFRGPELENLNSGPASSPRRERELRSEPADLFSDLNQWMIKVLLAPELPVNLLAAPRGHYRNASQLARAANVSVMSAFRLVLQLQREGYLHESDPYLRLVRRKDLFRRWQSSASRSVREVPVRFLFRSEPRAEVKRMLQSGRACLAMFAAAEAMNFGFVSGVPPHVYVQKLRPDSLKAWKRIVPAEPGEVPDLILRQAPAPQSIFRAQVMVGDVPVSDILQVWLDVSSHPARGHEQAELIERRVLDPILAGKLQDE